MFFLKVTHDDIFIRAFVEQLLESALVFVVVTIDVFFDTLYQLSLDCYDKHRFLSCFSCAHIEHTYACDIIACGSFCSS